MQRTTEPEVPDEAAPRAEAIVEPAVWVPDFPGDDPEMEYAHWRDQMFIYGSSESSG